MNYEILILGGGPAGLSTALHIQKLAPHLSARILLLEKEHYPRPKLCAGGLTPDAESLLEQLGLDAREVPHVDVPTARFDFEGKGLRIALPKRHVLRIIRRDEFDAWLAHKARAVGIEIQEGVTVQDVKSDSNGVTVITDKGEFRTRIAIGADGSNGVTRRCVLPKAPVYTARVLEVWTTATYRGARPSYFSKDGEAVRMSAVFEFSPVPHNISGYIWDFPTQFKGQPMRCWGIYDANLLSNPKRPPLKDLLREEMDRHGYVLDDYALKGHPIRWFEPGNRVAVPHILLVGDAAGADPLFGEGISIALGYGLWAAKETVRAIDDTNDISFNGSKFRLARSPLGQTLFARWFIANIVYIIKWRWFQILLWRILKPLVILVAWVFILNWGKRMRL